MDHEHMSMSYGKEELSELSTDEEAILAAPPPPLINSITTANSSSCTSSSSNIPQSDSAAALLITQGVLAGDAAVSSHMVDMKPKSPSFTVDVPYQDETGFDWLSSFNEDQSLIYDAPSFGMETFLFDGNEEPLLGNVEQLKQNEDDKRKIAPWNGVNNNNDGDAVLNNKREIQNKCKAEESYAAMLLMIPPAAAAAAGKASRSKRVRSNGWPSTSIICSWDKVSNASLDSTTSHVFPSMEIYDCHHQHEYQSLIKTPDTKFFKLGNHVNRQQHDHESKKSWVDDDDDDDDYDYEESGEHMSYGSDDKHSPPPPTRRCTHCLSTKTPQWRAGPAGPKTLCNACGVRYKSGRLFEEYRPAKSPTFVSHKHSNSHKKVMEMRRRKIGLHGPDTSSNHQRLSSNSSNSNSDHQMIKFKVKFNSSIQMPSQCSDAALINTGSHSIPPLESPTFLY